GGIPEPAPVPVRPLGSARRPGEPAAVPWAGGSAMAGVAGRPAADHTRAADRADRAAGRTLVPHPAERRDPAAGRRPGPSGAPGWDLPAGPGPPRPRSAGPRSRAAT